MFTTIIVLWILIKIIAIIILLGTTDQEHHRTCGFLVKLCFKQNNAKAFPPRLSIQTEKKVMLGNVG